MNKLTTSFLLAGLLTAPRLANAVCRGTVSPSDDIYTDSTTYSGSALTASSPHPTLGRNVVAQANTVQLAELGELTNSTKFTASSTVVNTPNTVRLSDGTYAVFVATQTGNIERWNIDPATGESTSETPFWTESISRGTTCGDKISATPVVHLRNLSITTDSFKAHYTTDLVYVATRFGGGCLGGSTDNQVIAYRVDTGAKVWTFNSGGGVDMDVVYEAPYLDLFEDRLYVGTDRSSPSQDTIWSIDVITGTKAWSAAVGPVWTTPMVRGETIYVGTLAGEIKALNKSDGATLWAIDNGGDPIITNIFPEFREPYNDLIAAVTLSGAVWMVRDDTWYGSEVWWVPALDTSVGATSRVAVDAEYGKVYVGANDGSIYQLGIVDGSIEASRRVDGVSTTVGDVSFVFDSGEGSDVSLIAGSSSGALAKFCGPWAAEVSPAKPNTGLCSSDAACGSTPPSECSAWRCINETCVAQPVTNGASCVAPVGVGVCKAGVCVGPTECQGSFAACKCDDYDGGYIRSLHTTPLDCTGLPSPSLPGDERPLWCTNEVSFAVSQNACVDHKRRTQTPFWVHLFDERRRPFEITAGPGNNITMSVVCRLGLPSVCQAIASPPVFYDSDGNEKEGEASLEAGTVFSTSRRGTYYALLGPQQIGTAYDGPLPQLAWAVRVTAEMTVGGLSCVSLQQRVFSNPLYFAGQDGCGLFSNLDQTGFLRVRVEDPQGAPIANAEVQVGYAKDKFFARNFEQSIKNTPSEPNWGLTNTNGYIRFVDHGNYMNGPTHVFATCPGKQFDDGFTRPIPAFTRVGPNGVLPVAPNYLANPTIVLNCPPPP